jgi:hypothetical protein
MSQFAFPRQEWPAVFEAAGQAEETVESKGPESKGPGSDYLLTVRIIRPWPLLAIVGQ